VGVDIAESVVQNAQQQYEKPNLTFLIGRADEIPCESGKFDVVVSFETIEHHDKHHEMLKEIKRVLKPGGILIISSPDKKFYSDIPGYSNPFHIKELYEKEFRNLISSYFKFSNFAAQRAGYFSVILPEAPVLMKVYGGSYNEVSQLPKLGPVYWIAIASDDDFSQKIEVPLFDGDSIIKKIKIEAQDKIKRSKSYRLGRLILLPLFLLQNFFNVKSKS
jgi:SAM-dependent methyltransferase